MLTKRALLRLLPTVTVWVPNTSFLSGNWNGAPAWAVSEINSINTSYLCWTVLNCFLAHPRQSPCCSAHTKLPNDNKHTPNSQEGVHAMKSVMTTHILVSMLFFCYWPHSSESISKWLLISLHTLFFERKERNTSMTMSCLGNCEVCTIHEHGSVHRFLPLQVSNFQQSITPRPDVYIWKQCKKNLPMSTHIYGLVHTGHLANHEIDNQSTNLQEICGWWEHPHPCPQQRSSKTTAAAQQDTMTKCLDWKWLQSRSRGDRLPVKHT